MSSPRTPKTLIRTGFCTCDGSEQFGTSSSCSSHHVGHHQRVKTGGLSRPLQHLQKPQHRKHGAKCLRVRHEGGCFLCGQSTVGDCDWPAQIAAVWFPRHGPPHQDSQIRHDGGSKRVVPRAQYHSLRCGAGSRGGGRPDTSLPRKHGNHDGKRGEIRGC